MQLHVPAASMQHCLPAHSTPAGPQLRSNCPLIEIGVQEKKILCPRTALHTQLVLLAHTCLVCTGKHMP